MKMTPDQRLRNAQLLVATLDRLNRPDFEPAELDLPLELADLKRVMWTVSQTTVRLLHYQRRLEKQIWLSSSQELPFSDVEAIRRVENDS